MYHVKSREIGFGLRGDEEGVEGFSLAERMSACSVGVKMVSPSEGDGEGTSKGGC
jgi:hypothetical protein